MVNYKRCLFYQLKNNELPHTKVSHLNLNSLREEVGFDFLKVKILYTNLIKFIPNSELY